MASSPHRVSHCQILLTTWSAAWANISRHALNTAFVLFEIALTRVGPTPWAHMLFLVLILAAYLGVAYITHVTQGFYSSSSFLTIPVRQAI
jgi:hypothetical protein